MGPPSQRLSHLADVRAALVGLLLGHALDDDAHWQPPGRSHQGSELDPLALLLGQDTAQLDAMATAGQQRRLGLIAAHKIALAPAPSPPCAPRPPRQPLHPPKAQIRYIHTTLRPDLHPPRP